jgi:hypothetical protein
MRRRRSAPAGLAWACGGAAVAFGACATLAYHPYDEETRTGYAEQQVGAAAFHVEFLGERDRVSMDAARACVVRRCAELARARGKRYFRLVEAHGDHDTSLYRHDDPGRASCYGAGLGHVGTAQCVLRPGQVRYERRDDRVRYRALCELADQPGARFFAVDAP